jgi:hypothetical protein
MGMMDSVESIRAKVQAQVPEPVLASGMVQPAGTWGAAGLTSLTPAGGLARQRSANKNAGSLSTRGAMFKTNRQTLLALTADKLYAFETKFGWGGMKLLSTLAVWDRADLTVQTQPGKISTRIIIDHTNGEHYELEATTVASRGLNDPLLAELASPSP